MFQVLPEKKYEELYFVHERAGGRGRLNSGEASVAQYV